jgi:hypothetical protein
LLRSPRLAIVALMADCDRLTPADPVELTGALAFALRFHGRKRVHNADEIMAEIVAKRLVEHCGAPNSSSLGAAGSLALIYTRRAMLAA